MSHTAVLVLIKIYVEKYFDVKIVILEKLNIPDLRCYKRTSFTTMFYGNGKHEFLFQLIIKTVFENMSHELEMRSFTQVSGSGALIQKNRVWY